MIGVSVVILAAGMGTRMKSATPKVLHRIAGTPLLGHVIEASRALNPQRIIVVIGHGGKEVEATFAKSGVTFVYQHEQLGTGHALIQTEAALRDANSDVFVLNGDGPLIRGETLVDLLQVHRAERAGMTIATCHVDDPTGLGRIVRTSDGFVQRIVEEKDATDEERTITEINPGLYIFSRNVFSHTANLSSDNKAGEYYITDLVALYRKASERVAAHAVQDANELSGINDRAELARAERLLQERYRAKWLTEGVTMTAPETVFFEPGVHIGRDVVLEPGVVLQGTTTIGDGAHIGAYSVIVNANVPPRARILPHTLKQAL